MLRKEDKLRKDDGMKKKIAVVLLLLLVSGNVLFADNLSTGLSLMASGGTIIGLCLPGVFWFSDGWYWGIGVGSAIAVLGAVLAFIPDRNEYALLKENPILSPLRKPTFYEAI
ncbi:hypothetical protein FACS1894137_18970 [Spirochaetia bacterium]|nr:hypothetical protein FACS1894137_18970 [Spirochaetia bacterium]